MKELEIMTLVGKIKYLTSLSDQLRPRPWPRAGAWELEVARRPPLKWPGGGEEMHFRGRIGDVPYTRGCLTPGKCFNLPRGSGNSAK